MDKASIIMRPDLPGIELLHARFQRYRYSRHAHSHSVIGLIEAGVQSYFYRGRRYITSEGGIFFVNPEEAHTGEAADDQGYTMRSLYPDATCLERLFEDSRFRRLLFREPVTYDPALWRKLRATHQAITAGEPRLTCETLLVAALSSLATKNAEDRPSPPNRRPPSRIINQIKTLLREEPGADRSLAELGHRFGMSPYHLAHAFVRQVGAPIFVYAEAQREEAAKRLLRIDTPLVQIAIGLGYADQSHFTRRFKRNQGVTPGEYRSSARSSKTA